MWHTLALVSLLSSAHALYVQGPTTNKPSQLPTLPRCPPTSGGSCNVDASYLLLGDIYTFDCIGGNCNMYCDISVGAVYFECSGGNCNQYCTGTSCTFRCSGGGCVQYCISSSNCRFICSGGHCTQWCTYGKCTYDIMYSLTPSPAGGGSSPTDTCTYRILSPSFSPSTSNAISPTTSDFDENEGWHSIWPASVNSHIAFVDFVVVWTAISFSILLIFVFLYLKNSSLLKVEEFNVIENGAINTCLCTSCVGIILVIVVLFTVAPVQYLYPDCSGSPVYQDCHKCKCDPGTGVVYPYNEVCVTSLAFSFMCFTPVLPIAYCIGFATSIACAIDVLNSEWVKVGEYESALSSYIGGISLIVAWVAPYGIGILAYVVLCLWYVCKNFCSSNPISVQRLGAPRRVEESSDSDSDNDDRPNASVSTSVPRAPGFIGLKKSELCKSLIERWRPHALEVIFIYAIDLRRVRVAPSTSRINVRDLPKCRIGFYSNAAILSYKDDVQNGSSANLLVGIRKARALGFQLLAVDKCQPGLDGARPIEIIQRFSRAYRYLPTIYVYNALRNSKRLWLVNELIIPRIRPRKDEDIPIFIRGVRIQLNSDLKRKLGGGGTWTMRGGVAATMDLESSTRTHDVGLFCSSTLRVGITATFPLDFFFVLSTHFPMEFEKCLKLLHWDIEPKVFLNCLHSLKCTCKAADVLLHLSLINLTLLALLSNKKKYASIFIRNGETDGAVLETISLVIPRSRCKEFERSYQHSRMSRVPRFFVFTDTDGPGKLRIPLRSVGLTVSVVEYFNAFCTCLKVSGGHRTDRVSVKKGLDLTLMDVFPEFCSRYQDMVDLIRLNQ